MANPQKENGYTSISNEILEAFARVLLPSYQRRIVDVIIRKTWGFIDKNGKHKIWDRIAYSQFEKFTGIRRQHIHRSILKLLDKRVIERRPLSKKGDYEYRLQKDYDKWAGLSPIQVTKPDGKIITHTGYKVEHIQVTKLSPIQVTTKERKKEKAKAFSVDIEKLSTFFRKNMKVKIKTQNEQGWLDAIDKMHRIDKRPYNEIQSLFEFIFSDPFWSNQPIGPISLRKKDRDGIMRFDKILAQMNRGLPKKRNLPSDIRL